MSGRVQLQHINDRDAQRIEKKKINKMIEAKKERAEMQLKKATQVKRDRVEMSEKAQELHRIRMKQRSKS